METVLGEPADEIMRGDLDDRWHAMSLAIVRFTPWLAEHLPDLRNCKAREIASFPRKGRGLAYIWHPGHGLIEQDGYVSKTFAVAYESDRRYQLWTPLTSGGRQVSYVYNYLTKAWTRRLKDVNCAHVLSEPDRLYLGHASDKVALRERKNFYAQTDYRDESTPQVIEAVSSVTFEAAAVTLLRLTWDLTLASRAPGVGDQVYQAGVGTANVMAVSDLTGTGTTREYELTLDRSLVFLPGACTVHYGIASRVRWAPETLGQTVATLKKFALAQVYLESLPDALDLSPWRFRLGFSGDIMPTETFTKDFQITTMLGGKVLRSAVPVPAQNGRSLNLSFEHNRAGERFDIVNVGYTGEVMSDTTTVTTLNP